MEAEPKAKDKAKAKGKPKAKAGGKTGRLQPDQWADWVSDEPTTGVGNGVKDEASADEVGDADGSDEVQRTRAPRGKRAIMVPGLNEDPGRLQSSAAI